MTRNQRQRLARLMMARTVKSSRPRAVMLCPPVLDVETWTGIAAPQQQEYRERVIGWSKAMEAERLSDPNGTQWLADIHAFNAAQPTPDMTGWRRVGGK